MYTTPLDAGLQDQLAAIAARRQGNVQRAPLRTVSAAGHFQNGVCLGVQNVPFGLSVVVLTGIGETPGCAIVAIRDDHAVLDQQRTYLLAGAVAEFGPFHGHTEVCPVVPALLFKGR